MSDVLPETPSQTAGPFLHIGMMPDGQGGVAPLAAPTPAGGSVVLRGTLTDAKGAPMADALIEAWDAQGGWARSAMDDAGCWRLALTRPDAVAFVSLWVIARGINTGLHTRLYFPDADWRADAAMARVPEGRRATLVASEEGSGAYLLDIRIGGERETVFFDL